MVVGEAGDEDAADELPLVCEFAFACCGDRFALLLSFVVCGMRPVAAELEKPGVPLCFLFDGDREEAGEDAAAFLRERECEEERCDWEMTAW